MKETTTQECYIMDTFLNNLKRQAAENPVLTLAVTAGLLTAASKLIGTGVDVRNSRAWAQEVQRRAMKDALK